MLILAFVVSCNGDEISREIGARCDQKNECEELCLVGDDFPGGFCSLSCFGDGDCVGGSQCVELSDLGVCMFPCAEAIECEFLGEEWTCIEAQSSETGQTIDVCGTETSNL